MESPTGMQGFEIGQKVIVTTDNWFYGPDGKSYRAAWGTLNGVFNDQETLGIKTNAKSANWYVRVGDVIVAGCQVHFVTKCAVWPGDYIQDHAVEACVVKEYSRPTHICKADGI